MSINNKGILALLFLFYLRLKHVQYTIYISVLSVHLYNITVHIFYAVLLYTLGTRICKKDEVARVHNYHGNISERLLSFYLPSYTG
jgi:hypothetical protein